MISFAESSFFPIPPDVMLGPMVLANRNKAFVYAGICTVASVLDHALSLLAGNGVSPGVVELMRKQVGGNRTHGWERAYDGWSGGSACSAATIGHTGFTGGGLWIDFAKGRAWTLLTNRVHPTRHFDSGIVGLRRAVGDLVNAE